MNSLTIKSLRVPSLKKLEELLIKTLDEIETEIQNKTSGDYGKIAKEKLLNLKRLKVKLKSFSYNLENFEWKKIPEKK